MQWGDFDERIFRSNHISLRNYAIDTGLLHFFTHPRQPHGLDYISALEHESAPRWKDTWGAKKDASRWDDPALAGARAIYNAQDCIIQDSLADELQEHLREVHNGEAIFRNAMENWRIGIDMWQWGVHIDQVKLLELQGPFLASYAEALERCQTLAGKAGFRDPKDSNRLYSPLNHHQTRRLFEECFRSKSRRLTGSGQASYDEETLLRFKEGGGAEGEMASAILEARERHKRILYVRDPPIWSDGRLHPEWAPLRASTGRWSCPGFPVQTIPKRTKEGKRLRQMFAPAPGKWFVCADYHQQEARFEALYSGEQELIEAFEKGINPYSVVGSKLFGGQVSQHRKGTASYDAAKMTFLALIYNVGNQSLLEQLRTTHPKTTMLQVAKLRNLFFLGFPAIRRYMNELEKKAIRDDYIEELITGYRYHYYGAPDPSHSLNFRNQSGGAMALLNQAMPKIRRELNADEEINLSVHDEIVVSGPDPYRLRAILRDCMETTLEYEGRKMRFPIEVSAGQTNWGQLEAFEK